jgi:hypothetical protein
VTTLSTWADVVCAGGGYLTSVSQLVP